MSRKPASGRPPARVIVLPVGVGALLAAVLSLMLGDWVAGTIVGVLFAAAFAAVVIGMARRDAKRVVKGRR